MKQITLNINENKFQAFFEFIKTLDYVSLPNEDWWSELSEIEKKKIKKGTKEIQEGKGISHEVVRTEIQALLK